MLSKENEKKRNFWFVKVLIRSQVFHKELLQHILCHYASCVTKQMCKICDRHISKEKYQNHKLIIENERTDWTCSWKKAVCLNKRTILFDKWAVGFSEWHVEVKYSPHRRLSLPLLVWIKKMFSEFNRVSDLQTLYLSKIGPVLGQF